MKVEFDDFDRYWATFSGRGAAKRAEHGCQGSKVLRKEANEHEALVLFDGDRTGSQAFLDDPEVAEVMSAAVLRGRPGPTYVGPGRELPS